MADIGEPAGNAPAFDRRRTIGLLCGLLSVFLFSSFTLASRLGFSSSLTLPDIAALRFGIGGMLLLPVLLRTGLAGVRWWQAALLALFGGLGFAPAAYAGFALAPAAHGAVLLHGTLPLTTLAVLSLSAPQRRTAAQKLGTLIIAGGIVLMGFDSWAGANVRQLIGDGFLLLASLLWSAYGVLSRRLGLPPAQGAAIVAVFSMCAFLPVYAVIPGKALLAVPLHALLLQILVQGVLIGAVSIFVYTRAVASLGPTMTAFFTAAVPCVTTLAAIPLLSEVPGPAGILGVVAVTSGMIMGLRAVRGETRL
ncbi:DMT family transporter [Dongia sp.]|uniref:DMT family transporter n=1 Tax=Dongia sp. TaxID=1977262 RepID=UPI0037500818